MARSQSAPQARVQAQQQARTQARSQAQQQARGQAHQQARNQAAAQARNQAAAQARNQAAAQARNQAAAQARQHAASAAAAQARQQAAAAARQHAASQAAAVARQQAAAQARQQAAAQAHQQAAAMAAAQARQQAAAAARQQAATQAAAVARQQAAAVARQQAAVQAAAVARQQAAAVAAAQARQQAAAAAAQARLQAAVQPLPSARGPLTPLSPIQPTTPTQAPSAPAAANLFAAVDSLLNNTVTLAPTDTPANTMQDSSSGTMYFVDYYRAGDGPDGGELYGVYNNMADSQKAVAEVKKWAAEIQQPGSSWNIVKVEIEKMGSPTPPDSKKDSGTDPKTDKAPAKDSSASTKPSDTSARKQPEQHSDKEAKEEKPGEKAREKAERLGAVAEGVKNGLKEQLKSVETIKTNAEQAREFIAQQLKAGKITPSQALVRTQGVDRREAALIGREERRIFKQAGAAVLSDGVKDLAEGIKFGTDAYDVLSKAMEEPTTSGKVHVGLRETIGKIVSTAMGDVVLEGLLVGVEAAGLATISVPGAIAMGVVIGVSSVVGDSYGVIATSVLENVHQMIHGTRATTSRESP